MKEEIKTVMFGILTVILILIISYIIPQMIKPWNIYFGVFYSFLTIICGYCFFSSLFHGSRKVGK